jgi:hypothetical protein
MTLTQHGATRTWRLTPGRTDEGPYALATLGVTDCSRREDDRNAVGASQVSRAEGTSSDRGDLLTADEREALALSGQLAKLCRRIVGSGPQAADDWSELASRIHAVQHTIMAQAAARAYPFEFRLLGQVFDHGESEEKRSEIPAVFRLKYDDGTLSDDSVTSGVEFGISRGRLEFLPVGDARLHPDKEGESIGVFSTQGEALLWLPTARFGPGDTVELKRES